MKNNFMNLEHPDIESAMRTGYPRCSWDDSGYDDYDGMGDYEVDIDALFEEAKLSEWDRKYGAF